MHSTPRSYIIANESKEEWNTANPLLIFYQYCWATRSAPQQLMFYEKGKRICLNKIVANTYYLVISSVNAMFGSLRISFWNKIEGVPLSLLAVKFLRFCY